MNNIAIGGRTTVNPEEVIMLKADINYTIVHYADGTKCVVATTLKRLEARFAPHHFYRTNKSFLVNLNCIKHFFSHSNSLQMSNNQVVTVSRRKKVGLMKCLNEA